jgi:uncharacterized protein YjbI with pentapeptide repeats
LRGQVFDSQDLSGTDFSYADIRGASFIRAKLSGANFTGARAGLQTQWMVIQSIAIFFLLLLSGTLLGVTGTLTAACLMPAMVETYTSVPGFMAVIVLHLWGIAAIRHGLVVEPFSNLAVVLVVVFAFAFGLCWISSSSGAGAFTLIMVSAMTGAFLSMFSLTVVGSHLGQVALIVVAILSAIVAFSLISTKCFVSLSTGASLSASIIVLLLLTLSVHIAQGALEPNQRYAPLRTMGTAFAATGGTTFYRSDLTASNFSRATLRNTNFRDTLLD